MARYKEFWYNSWRSMMNRCHNKNSANYKYYGGKGIFVCDEWKDAEKFGRWAKASGWFDGATLDRIDNNGNYEPSNCRWATKKNRLKIAEQQDLLLTTEKHIILLNGQKFWV